MNNVLSDMGQGVRVNPFVTDFGVPPAYQACPPEAIVDEKMKDTYIWRNRTGVTGALIDAINGPGDRSDCSVGNDYPLEGREFFDDTTNSGVRCGTLANIPITCSIGQGYWATAQSCSDLTGLVGVAPSTPISGTLYKCTAPNTWTSYYTPYTYPHPLAGGSPTTYTMTYATSTCQSITGPSPIDSGTGGTATTTPGSGKHFVSISGDTCTGTGTTSWVFSNITANCTVTATCAADADWSQYRDKNGQTCTSACQNKGAGK